MNTGAKKVIKPLVDTPHTLIAGTTGSGKSVLLNDILKYIVNEPGVGSFFDLKRVELGEYKHLGFCQAYITEPEDVVRELNTVLFIMEERFKRMTSKKSCEAPYYVIIDELGDMLTIKGVLERLVKIGRLGRAANIHLICATQDPSRRTLPAQFMQNFTCTVALRCRSAIESRQIIGVSGAETLPKYGYAFRWDDDGIEKFKVPFIN